jgi:hypothetical protein
MFGLCSFIVACRFRAMWFMVLYFHVFSFCIVYLHCFGLCFIIFWLHWIGLLLTIIKSNTVDSSAFMLTADHKLRLSHSQLISNFSASGGLQVIVAGTSLGLDRRCRCTSTGGPGTRPCEAIYNYPGVVSAPPPRPYHVELLLPRCCPS